jgi:hypothetical protein
MHLAYEMDFQSHGTRSRFSLLSFRHYASIVPNRPFAAALPPSVSGASSMSLRSLALLSFCVLLAACSKVNQENYSKLSAGMPKAEVESLLGSPTECSGALGMSSCTWGDQKSFISVQYAGDKVVLFSGQGLK